MPSGTRPAPPDDTVRVALSGLTQSMPWAMIMWLNITSSGVRVAADLASILTTVSSSMNTTLFANWVNSSTTLTQVQGVWKTPGGGEIVSTNTTVRTGAGTGTMNNVAACAVLNWHIDQYYRGGKPRSYLPGPPSNAVTDGVHITSSQLTTLTTQAEAFRVAVNAASSGGITSVKLGTVSFQRANEWRVPPVFYPYNSVTVRATLGIQRRRLLP